MLRGLLMFALLGVPAVSSGCALTTDTVHIQYHSATAPSPIPEAAHVVVEVRSIEGRSGQPDKISSKKNGYGMEMAPILSDRPVLQIVQEAISDELRSEGFQIGAGSLIVTAEVDKFSTDYKVAFWSANAVAEVTLSMQVRDRGDHIIYACTLTGEGNNGGAVIMDGENARIPLESALSAVIVRLMSDPAFTRALLDTSTSRHVS